MLKALAAELGLTFRAGSRVMPDGTRVELDAISENPPVLVEAWSHHGRPKSAQKQKVMTDALKLVWAEAVLFPSGARKILAFADEAAAAHFRGASWMAAALVHLGIEVLVVEVPDDVREAIRRAQLRQFR